LVDWAAGDGPLYLRLAQALRRAAERGELTPGERLPAERLLAQALGISRSTVVASYEQLADDGWLERRQGSGTYVAIGRGGQASEALPDAGSAFGELFGAGEDVIDFSLAAPLAAPAVLDALGHLAGYAADAETLGRGYLPAGLPGLRSAIAGYLTAIGLDSAERHILVTSGGQQAISLLASLWVSRGDAVVVESPSYPGALDAFRAAGARLLTIPVDDDGADVGSLRELLARAAVRVVYVTPSYNNPTGSLLSHTRRRELARIAQEFQVPIIEDLVTAESVLVPGAEVPPVGSFSGDGWITTIGSMSKLFWGGLRVGWVRGSEQTVFRLTQLKALADLGSSLLPQFASLELFGRLAEVRAWRRADCQPRLHALRGWLSEYLPDWAWQEPAGGNDLWVHLPRGSATEFLQLASRFGVSAAAGPLFSADGGHADYVRLSFLLDVADLKEGVRRLAQAWRAYLPRSAAPANQVRTVV
jgi:DNA-binding transcriptional MocR family regulator